MPSSYRKSPPRDESKMDMRFAHQCVKPRTEVQPDSQDGYSVRNDGSRYSDKRAETLGNFGSHPTPVISLEPPQCDRDCAIETDSSSDAWTDTDEDSDEPPRESHLRSDNSKLGLSSRSSSQSLIARGLGCAEKFSLHSSPKRSNNSDRMPLMVKVVRRTPCNPPKNEFAARDIPNCAPGEVLSPHETRRRMIRHELNYYLRLNLALGRHCSASTSNAVLSRRHTPIAIANLNKDFNKADTKHAENNGIDDNYDYRSVDEGYHERGW